MASRTDRKQVPEGAVEMHLRLWLDTEKGVLFGGGRALLLEGIERHGSLRKAAKDLRISYRAAWGKIKRTEEILGFDLVERTASPKQGYRLTEAGRKLKDDFDRWRSEVEEIASEKANAIFTSLTIKREEKGSSEDRPAER